MLRNTEGTFSNTVVMGCALWHPKEVLGVADAMIKAQNFAFSPGKPIGFIALLGG
jgi:hypothetical protein